MIKAPTLIFSNCSCNRNVGFCEKSKAMEGIKYVMDEQNRKVAVQIDLEKYGELWEAIYDAIVAESRKDEESVDWEKAKQNLKDEGKL
jgi:hypothetical protein